MSRGRRGGPALGWRGRRRAVVVLFRSPVSGDTTKITRNECFGSPADADFPTIFAWTVGRFAFLTTKIPFRHTYHSW